MRIFRIWLAGSLQLFAFSFGQAALTDASHADDALNKLRADPTINESYISSRQGKLVAQEKKIVHQLALDMLSGAGCVDFKEKARDAIYKYIKSIGYITPKLTGDEFFNAFKEALVINTFGNPPKSKLPALNKQLTRLLKEMPPLFNGTQLDDSAPSFFNSVDLHDHSSESKNGKRRYAMSDTLVSTLKRPPTTYPAVTKMESILSRLQKILGKNGLDGKGGFKIVCGGGGPRSNAIVLDMKDGGEIKLSHYLEMDVAERPVLAPHAVKVRHDVNPTETVITQQEPYFNNGLQNPVPPMNHTNPFWQTQPQPQYQAPYRNPMLEKLFGSRQSAKDTVDYYLSLSNRDPLVSSQQRSKSWQRDYSKFAEALLRTRDRELLSDRLFSKFSDVCHGVTDKFRDENDRIDFILRFMKSLQAREGGPLTITKEPHFLSEGLFQLSTSDRYTYGCVEIDARGDRAIGLDGAIKTRVSHEYLGNPDKTILNPYKNISCYMRILKTQLQNYSHLIQDNNYSGPLRRSTGLYRKENDQFMSEFGRNLPECRRG